MEVKAHFSAIHQVIISHLQHTKDDITAAVAWFTDREIFDELCKKARAGVRVSVALMGDNINQGAGGLNFSRLTHLGGQVVFLPAGSHTEPLMHHKFCVIDRSTIITGSYNWSMKARSNDENITVFTEAPELARQFLDTFASLVDRTGADAPVEIDADAVRRRLEMIRNLILLGEPDDMASHLRMLRPAAGPLRLERIITALDAGQFQAALGQIDAYLCRVTTLVVAETADILDLRFHLQILELRLAGLSDEKADLERRLIAFNCRHDDALGELIRRLLEAQARLARLRANRKLRQARVTEAAADEAEVAAGEAKAAEDAFQEYSKQHEELQDAVPLPRLDEAAERDLKAFYRKACMLCHPDKVSEASKSAAQQVFLELQCAYKSNDLATVKQIYETLQSGIALQPRFAALSEAAALRAAIAELEHAVDLVAAELIALQNSDGVQLMEMAGDSETQWQAFFKQQGRQLEKEITLVEASVSAEMEHASHE